MHRAVRDENNLRAIKTLIKFKADINARNVRGVTPLHLAASSGCTKIVEFLIEKKAGIENNDSINHTPLTHAVISGKIETARSLINFGAKVDILDQCGNDMIYLACTAGKIEIAEILMAEYGLSITTPIKYDPILAGSENFEKSHNILQLAIKKKNLELIKFIISSYKVNISAIPAADGVNALEDIVNYSDAEILRHLINKYQIDVEAKYFFGQNLLHYVVNSKNIHKLKIIDFLLNECQANVNAKTIFGKDALNMAISKKDKDIEVVKFLVKKGADIGDSFLKILSYPEDIANVIKLGFFARLMLDKDIAKLDVSKDAILIGELNRYSALNNKQTQSADNKNNREFLFECLVNLLSKTIKETTSIQKLQNEFMQLSNNLAKIELLELYKNLYDLIPGLKDNIMFANADRFEESKIFSLMFLAAGNIIENDLDQDNKDFVEKIKSVLKDSKIDASTNNTETTSNIEGGEMNPVLLTGQSLAED